MKLKMVAIRNFRCCKSIELDIDSLHALVGANNSGKSSILHAMDFLFNPSATKLGEESFSDRDTTKPIRVEALFVDLSAAEKEALKANTRADGTFLFARTANLAGDSDGETSSDGEGKIKTGQEYCRPQPKLEWLKPANAKASAIAEWWKEKEKLIANGQSFADFVGDKRPTVEDWKTKAGEFCEKHLKPEDYVDEWVANPQGFAGVLKANLPHFELIPAVRDAADESKVLKTNPFGRLIYELMRTLDPGLRDEIAGNLKKTTRRLNREGKDERIPEVKAIEDTMMGFLGELMPADLEIEFPAPTLEVLLSSPRLFIDDGFRGSVEGKGHGTQRAVIFSILRTYAKTVTNRSGHSKRTLILAVEEPELYMHPTAQRLIRRVLRAIADGEDQVLFSTHSPLLVDVGYFDEIVRVEAGPSGARVHQLPMSKMIEDLEARHAGVKPSVNSMRARYGHAYTSSRNEGFFARRVLLVEGQTETYCLPIYARAIDAKNDFDLLGLATIECGGKGQIDRLFRVFNELGIPCYVLFDYDKSNTDAVARKASKDLLRFLGATLNPDPPAQACHQDRFSCFAEKWETDLQPEIPEYEKLAGAATKELGDCGKPLQARYIATQLTQRTPAVIPKLVQEIVGRAVKVSHGGSCLKCKEKEAVAGGEEKKKK